MDGDEDKLIEVNEGGTEVQINTPAGGNEDADEKEVVELKKFMGQKERRKSSSLKSFLGDYLNLANSSRPVQKLMAQNGDRSVIFSDIVIKINKRNKMQERIMLLTEHSFYNIDPANNKCKRKILIKDLGSVSVSKLPDNFFVLHVPKEYDYLMVSSKKTEIITKLVEIYEKVTRNPLLINFSNSFEYRTPESEREIHFTRVEGGVSTQIYIKPKPKK